MPKFASFVAGILALVTAVIVLPGAGTASAAPVGAATNLSFGSQVCNSAGTVSGTLSWSPSGLGSQYVDLSPTANFSNYSRGGPYGSNANAVNLVQLKKGTTYYARVLTVAGGGAVRCWEGAVSIASGRWWILCGGIFSRAALLSP